MQDDDGDDDAVDESWIKSSMDVSLFSSKALEFACSSTRGADLLQRYVHSNAVGRMVRAVVLPLVVVLTAFRRSCAYIHS